MLKKCSLKRNIISIFLLFLCFHIILMTQTKAVVENETNKTNTPLYLSDIAYIQEKTIPASGHEIRLDKNEANELMKIKVNGQEKKFIKGICSWATSTIVYDLSNYDYDYFTAYIGIDSSEQSDYFNTGAKFYIYTSTDGENWGEPRLTSEVLYGWSDAQFIKIDIKNANYLKLVADDNSDSWWANWYDETVFADAKLIKEDYEEDLEPLEFIKTVEEYDSMIKEQNDGQEIAIKDELTLLQREFVKNVGYEELTQLAKYKPEYKETIIWLMNDVENLRLYTMGGKPDGNYVSSIKVLVDLYTTYKNDFEITEMTKYGTVLGDLYKKMAITLSLTHSTDVRLWMDSGKNPENESDAVTRYEIYKQLHKNGKFVVSERQDHTGWYERLTVEEMRFVMNNIIDDEEILWLNEYTQKYIDAHPGQEEKYLQPHPYMKYVWPDYTRPEYYAEENKQKWDDKYDFLRYGITYKPGVPKLWMNLESGAVCGGISKIGSNIRGVHGTPSSVISQPGHAAIIYYRENAEGKGYWTIDNDVSGWAQSGRTEKLSIRMPNGWGSGEYASSFPASYILLAQGALNDFENYQKAEEILLLANTYENDLQKREEIYRKAIEIQPINFDAWYELIKMYQSDKTRTEEEYYTLAKEMTQELKYYPLPMYDLLKMIAKSITSTENSVKLTLLQTRVLTEATQVTNEQSIQAGAVKAVANYLLGNENTEIATFSFDGEDAGKIKLSSRFDESIVRWEYSLDGKATWKETQEHKIQLSQEEIEKITAENDIYVHIVGVDYSDDNIYQIDIQKATFPTNIYKNEWENQLIGTGIDNLEWREKGKNNWITYEKENVDFRGEKDIEVRIRAKGTSLPSDIVKYHFEAENYREEQVYIPIKHLSIHAVSSEATANGGHAINAIDGNANTIWHTAYDGSDKDKEITIKLDETKYISAIEYLPRQSGINGRIKNAQILTSMDGETWIEAGKIENWANNEKLKEIVFEESVQANYVKIKILGNYGDGRSFATAAIINLYEDTTKKEPEILLGDIDNDGEITANDMAKLKLHLIDIEKLSEEQLKVADLDQDNEITANDMAKMQLMLIGIID